MKKKIILAISVLMLSNLAMAAPAKNSVELSLSNLEAQLEKLTQLEEQKYKEQEALANAAAQRLENYRKMDEVVSQRISQIEENVNKVIFSKEFKNKASEFLKQEGLRDGITNFDCFCDDCLNDGRYRKILARMNDENINVSSLYENHENIKKTINMFDLKIRYIDDTQFSVVYENKSQIMDILRILRDSYYRSIINEKIGVDDK